MSRILVLLLFISITVKSQKTPPSIAESEAKSALKQSQILKVKTQILVTTM